jgi:UDP-N-acetylmuramoyl-L-alanyl-D-glutamate--2,6-diaminopimelate ligase
VQRRAFGLGCEVAVFTNLSRDHLDYHGTMERYLDAKLMLFDGRNRAKPVKPTVAVVNLDDAAGATVAAAARHGGLEVITYGTRNGVTLRIANLEAAAAGLAFDLESAPGRRRITLPLLGRYNAWNAAAAFGASLALGVPEAVAVEGLSRAPAVPGRLEPVRAGQPFQLVVDYAHTPDALERALGAAREHATGRVLLVFGCGGDRDRAKRPRMGAIAAERADRAWVTSDNPRSEDPARIAAEVRAGDGSGRLEVELDRRAAIATAIAEARPGDIVVVAGKGHETTQTIGDRVLPFDDREVARSLMGAGSST